METTNYDYYYSDESGQFSFYLIPRKLIVGEEFKLLAELDIKNGIGLIERVKHGQSHPVKIYVKRFISLYLRGLYAVSPVSTEKQDEFYAEHVPLKK